MMPVSPARIRAFAQRRVTMASLALQGALPRPGRPHALAGELIVSLTSFRARFRTLPYTLRSLLSQSVQPDRVVLWLGHEDAAALPESISRLRGAGLTIGVTEDLRSYTKIVPTLERWPEALVATADDDVYYEPRWLEALVETWSGRHGEIVFHRGHTIRRDSTGAPLPYGEWDYERVADPLSALSFPTGVGGVLYPPGALDPQVTDKAAFKALCPQADDVWLYWMGRRAGSLYRHTGRDRPLLHWPGSQETGLFRDNVQERRNDEQIRNLVARFGFPEETRPAPVQGAVP